MVCCKAWDAAPSDTRVTSATGNGQLSGSFCPSGDRLRRPPRYDWREVFNAIMYVTKTGCPWRFLRHDFLGWRLVIITSSVGRSWDFGNALTTLFGKRSGGPLGSPSRSRRSQARDPESSMVRLVARDLCGRRQGTVFRSFQGSGNGFRLLAKRWIVERTFSWFTHYRRLAKDYEVKHSEAFIYAAAARLMLRRLAPSLIK